jgi:multicomponent Na+:H+ antiporter subunit G
MSVITSLLVLAGVAMILIAAIGVVRLPDVLCRSHAAAKALTLGIFLMLLGMWTHLGQTQNSFKIALIIFFQVVTIPVASHLLGLLALEKNLPRWKSRPIDQHGGAASKSPDA